MPGDHARAQARYGLDRVGGWRGYVGRRQLRAARRWRLGRQHCRSSGEGYNRCKENLLHDLLMVIPTGHRGTEAQSLKAQRRASFAFNGTFQYLLGQVPE